MLQPIRVEVTPGQIEICQVYEMEELLSVASTRIATMYHNNPVSLLTACCALPTVVIVAAAPAPAPAPAQQT